MQSFYKQEQNPRLPVPTSNWYLVKFEAPHVDWQREDAVDNVIGGGNKLLYVRVVGTDAQQDGHHHLGHHLLALLQDLDASSAGDPVLAS